MRSLHDEMNLLHYSIHSVTLEEILKATKKAVILLNALRINLMSISEMTEDCEIAEYVFPCERDNLLTVVSIGFPQE